MVRLHYLSPFRLKWMIRNIGLISRDEIFVPSLLLMLNIMIEQQYKCFNILFGENFFQLSLIIIYNLISYEWSDRLLEDFKNIFTAWKSCEMMNKTAYKKFIAPVGHKLWPLKDWIFNRDSCHWYALHVIAFAYIQINFVSLHIN